MSKHRRRGVFLLSSGASGGDDIPAGVQGWGSCSEQAFHEDGFLGVEAVLCLVEDLAGMLLEHF